MTANPGEVPALKAALRAAWQRSDQLFGMLPPDALLDRPIGLRHPFLFYLGHLPAFLWNQVGRGVLGLPSATPALDELFERGIDPLSEDDATTLAAWPAIEDVLAYRDRVRAWALDEAFERVARRAGDVLADRHRVMHLVLEHELMHHETLLYMLQEQPLARTIQGRLPGPVTGPPRAGEPRRIPAGVATLGGDFEGQPFGWDNEFPAHRVDVPEFTIDSLPVTVQQWRRFVDDGGPRPHGWVDRRGVPCVRSMFALVPLEDAAGWPVQVSHAQATAYAAWAGARLPTEAELHRAAYGAPEGAERIYPWGDEAPSERHGVFDFNLWSPEPVGRRPGGASAFGVQELVGNGWEWTSTPFRPLPGFTPWARTYPGYSADFFDDAHFVVCGGSWATDKRLLRRSFRNWYQGQYPFVFSAFRLVR